MLCLLLWFSQIAPWVYILTKALEFPFFILLLMMAICGAQVGMNDKAYLYHIYYKVKNSIQGQKKFVQSDQDVHVYD
jgi:hypothetical protein